MCGRYALTLPPEAVRLYFNYADMPNFPPRYNIAPTQPVAIVRAQWEQGRGMRSFMLARWGFLPGFVKDPKKFPLIINARADGIAQKPSFRAAIRRRRCLFIADAWYEWQTLKDYRGKPFKRPFLFRRPNGGPIAIAGLYETWSDPFGGEVDTACLITTDANASIAAVHDRMPVILEPEHFDLWLDCRDDRLSDDVLRLLRPAEERAIEFFQIGAAVNKVANDGPEIQTPRNEE